jgi:hypothetical protein
MLKIFVSASSALSAVNISPPQKESQEKPWLLSKPWPSLVHGLPLSSPWQILPKRLAMVKSR